jgi:hypothetical protein
MHQSLEHQEHAHHAAEHGNKRAALLVAVLAALLAIAEQQGKHAEIRVETNAIASADAWAQYQAKSTRETVAGDIARILPMLDSTTDPALAEKRAALTKQLGDESKAFDLDPKNGKRAIAVRARAFEEERGHALEQSHTFDNAAAAFELGIVLATASAITSSKMLIRIALTLGLVGLVLGVLGLTHPEFGAF